MTAGPALLGCCVGSWASVVRRMLSCRLCAVWQRMLWVAACAGAGATDACMLGL